MDEKGEALICEFAAEFVGDRNRYLASGNTEGFVHLYACFFDAFLAKLPKYKDFDRERFLEECREYALEHGPDA